MIPYCQHLIENEEIEEVVSTLKSGWLTTGPRTVQFEKMFAEYVGCDYAVAVSSCTAGLHLALVVAGVGAGDEVITTPMTFCATAEVIEYLGAKPVFVDIQEDTFNIDPVEIEKAVTERTKAILPVHYGGIPCDLSAIQNIAQKHGLIIVEDAAHAAGSVYREQKIGSHGNMAAFSFYPTKNMTTGEGGIITTNDAKSAEMLKILSLHGISKDAWKRYSNEGSWYYEVQHIGYKYNFTDLQAALGMHQLQKLDRFNKSREHYAELYINEIANIPGISLPAYYQDYFTDNANSGSSSAWHLFVMMLELDALTIDRSKFIDELNSKGIGVSVHFIPLHLQPFYADKYQLGRGDFPIAEKVYDRIISLPLYPKLQTEQIHYIIESLGELAQKFHR